jgi:hypothetical protein
VTDAAGVAILNLFPNAPAPTGLGTQGTTYRIWAAIPTGRNVSYNARVPNMACRLENILVLDDVGPLSLAELAIVQAQQFAADAANTAALQLLATWAQNESFRVVAATRNADEAMTAATIEWPDGTGGAFTADALSVDFPGAVDAWHATYLGTPARTVTQPAVTRDSAGAISVQPAITIA